jgi:hypothetical protein
MKNAAIPRIIRTAHTKINSTYWSRRATMIHIKAADIRDPKLKERLRRIALEYERLATDTSGQSRSHLPALCAINTDLGLMFDQKPPRQGQMKD